MSNAWGRASDVTLESPDASHAETRFEIEVNGGTNRVTVGRRPA